MSRFIVVVVGLLSFASCGDSIQVIYRESDGQSKSAAGPSSPHGNPLANPHGGQAFGGHSAGDPPSDLDSSLPEGAVIVKGLIMTPPEEWVQETPRSSARSAQYALPPAEGDSDTSEFVAFHFGAGGGGPVRDNLDRWCGQVHQPDGRPSQDVAEIDESTRDSEGGSVKVTTLKVSGNYKDPGMISNPKIIDGPARLFAAVVEGRGGPWFIKVIGPEKSMLHWEESLVKLLETAVPR